MDEQANTVEKIGKDKQSTFQKLREAEQKCSRLEMDKVGL